MNRFGSLWLKAKMSKNHFYRGDGRSTKRKGLDGFRRPRFYEEARIGPIS